MFLNKKLMACFVINNLYSFELDDANFLIEQELNNKYVNLLFEINKELDDLKFGINIKNLHPNFNLHIMVNSFVENYRMGSIYLLEIIPLCKINNFIFGPKLIFSYIDSIFSFTFSFNANIFLHSQKNTSFYVGFTRNIIKNMKIGKSDKQSEKGVGFSFCNRSAKK